ncbi:CpsD/CapB family tyrosine-protein kinase [Thalassococcus sp. S3]|uniref:CpsD/CapB family tyrosine-protein kinase n=1 Tax=Thalassococcus sp. S3 TaxID=2017482 RepID=UPI001024201A|nr:CpsD/CapB family tyrosine-protein kinase [Thalassococcus sp. S3]QBF31992.1 exopolysaccharide biosynthesis protein [Thalassococcus sp. S3]
MKDSYGLSAFTDADKTLHNDDFLAMRRMKHQRNKPSPRSQLVNGDAESVLAETGEIPVRAPQPAQQPVRQRRSMSIFGHGIGAPSLARQVVDPLNAEWDGLPLMTGGLRGQVLSDLPLVSLHRDSAVAKSFDLLRTRLMQTLKANGWNRIAIASPTPGCGATFTAVNLALSLSRVPASRTVLMDLNQRAPGVAKALDIGTSGPMHQFLSGEVAMEDHLIRATETLALGLNGAPSEDAAEILHDPATGDLLGDMIASLRPDVVLYDMPAVLAHDDLAAFLPHVDGVLLVSDGEQTTAKHLAECERILEGQTQLLGVILNRARASSIERYDA